MEAVRYYDKIAHLYDIMYSSEAGFDHLAQVQWVDGWREKLGLPKAALDLACGTGRHLACFEALEYQCFGIDASQEMLKVAAKRLNKTLLAQGFFDSFRLPQQVPLITSFFNALSYNKNLKELRAALENIWTNLLEGGLLIFDIACVDSPEKVFDVREFAGEGLEFSRTFVGIPTAGGFRSTMLYVVFDGASVQVIEETTVRGTFKVEDVKQALADAGFILLYDGSGYSPGLTVFVAQKQDG